MVFRLAYCIICYCAHRVCTVTIISRKFVKKAEEIYKNAGNEYNHYHGRVRFQIS